MRSVAILGAGIGGEHMKAYLTLTDRFKVAAVCDSDAVKAEKLASLAPGCEATAHIDAVIDDSNIEIIDICLPPHLHGPVALKAFLSGKHVICEKPLAGSVSEADQMVEAARASQCLLAPIFQYRYGRGIYLLAGLQERGLAGTPLIATLETHWDRGADYYAVPWRGQWESERGGAVLGHAIHIHDLVTRFFGHVSAVSALVDTRVNPIEVEDCAAISMRTSSGGLVTSSVTLGSAGNMSRLRLVFGGLTAESGHNPYAPGADVWRFKARDPDEQQTIDDALSEIETEMAHRPSGYAGQFLEIARRLDGKSADMVPPEDGVRSIELVAAIYHAARSGSRVSLPLDRTLPVCTDWTPSKDLPT
ncbi:MAG: Gfo/Idh/MocA family oxidoreductase [Pseudomonadota bacterium]